jgi:aminodeoxyfutalosine synthase
MLPLSRLHSAGLADIAEKLDAGQRLTLDDGVRLFEAPDLLAVGALANREREKRHAGKTFYNYNIRLEATNVCVASCLFCSFARLKPGDTGAYTMSLEQGQTSPARASAAHRDPRRQRPPSRSAVHCQQEMLRGQAHRPGIHLKCFTAVEILSRIHGMTVAGARPTDRGGPRFARAAAPVSPSVR